MLAQTGVVPKIIVGQAPLTHFNDRQLAKFAPRSPPIQKYGSKSRITKRSQRKEDFFGWVPKLVIRRRKQLGGVKKVTTGLQHIR
jgi:hypothetical protein